VTASFSARARHLFSFILLLPLVVRGQIAPVAVPVGSTQVATLSPTAVDSPNWISWGGFETGVGFRDNVLLSHSAEQRSGFVRGGVDATIWHPPSTRIDYRATINATGKRYFSTQSVNHEEQVIALTTWSYRAGNAFTFSIDGVGSYSHLLYDVSDTEVLLVVSEIKRSMGSLGPTVRWAFRPKWFIEAQGGARRETYPDGFNNRSIREGSVRFGWKPGTRFEASIAAKAWRRDYDVREQYNVAGQADDGTVLGIREREAELRLKAKLDAAGSWATVTRVIGTEFSDNGSGFLDYRERSIGQELDWTGAAWKVEFAATARRREYGLQKVGVGVAQPPRVRDAFELFVRLERKLTSNWTAFAEYLWERNRSNDAIASYNLNEGLLGVRWNWEK